MFSPMDKNQFSSYFNQRFHFLLNNDSRNNYDMPLSLDGNVRKEDQHKQKRVHKTIVPDFD